jgi:hypothetical protein
MPDLKGLAFPFYDRTGDLDRVAEEYLFDEFRSRIDDRVPYHTELALQDVERKTGVNEKSPCSSVEPTKEIRIKNSGSRIRITKFNRNG